MGKRRVLLTKRAVCEPLFFSGNAVPQAGLEICQFKHKQLFCTGAGSILIDDREKTIREWREAGGTGILHVSAEKTRTELKRLGVL